MYLLFIIEKMQVHRVPAFFVLLSAKNNTHVPMYATYCFFANSILNFERYSVLEAGLFLFYFYYGYAGFALAETPCSERGYMGVAVKVIGYGSS